MSLDSSQELKNRAPLRVLFSVLIVALFLTYLVPLAVRVFLVHPLAYTNAWDEATYLSYQAARAMAFRPGYWQLWLVVALHKLGISGAWQNLVFDAFVVPLSFFALFKILHRAIGVFEYAITVAALLFFGDVFLNSSNPIIESLGPSRGFWIQAREVFPAVLRTPNPQLSYCLLAAAACLCFQRKIIWPIIAVLPFLYWTFLLPVPFLTLLFVANLFPKLREIYERRFILFILFSAVFTLGALAVLSFIWLQYDPALTASDLSKGVSHGAIFSPALAVVFLCTAIHLRWIQSFKGSLVGVFSANLINRIVIVIFGAQCVLNFLPLVSPVVLSPSAVQASPSGLLAMASVSIVFLELAQLGLHVGKMLGVLVLLGLCGVLLHAQNFDFSKLHYKIFLGESFTKSQLEEIRRDPDRALIEASWNRDAFALMYPEAKLPPLATPYQFPFLSLEYPDFVEMNMRAIRYVESRPDLDKYFRAEAEKQNVYFSELQETQTKVGLETNIDGAKSSAGDRPYFVIPTQDKDPWVTFP